MALRIGTLECRVLVMRRRFEPCRFPLDRDVIRVGRGLDCEVQIEDRMMGLHHCRLVRSDGHFTIEEDNSPGGSYLNNDNKVIKPVSLHIGDIVSFGGRRTVLHFEHRGRSELEQGAHPLLAAICADPHDEAPRLVYGDWLSDRGDPRGELIHYQIGVERLPSRSPQRTELKARAQALIERHESAWLQPLPSFVESWRFRHGFLSAVLMEPRAVLDSDDLAALRRVHPIRAVGFAGFPAPEVLDQLAASPKLDGITQVELQFGIDHEGLAARFGSGARAGVFGAERRYFTTPKRLA